jgi:phospholipid/cholesterol/gamma-HCH transport system ATP-binding protein
MTETVTTDSVTAPANVVMAVEHVGKSFGSAAVLTDVSSVVRRGETVVIIGPSGCGKSTLLRILAGLYRPDAGRVVLLGEDLAQLSPQGLDAVRKRCGLVFQFGALYNSLTVGENIALALREHTALADEVITIMVGMKLQLVGLQGIQQLLPEQLSGGMQKRVGLARALALDPELLFYDEPTAGLDPVMAGVIDRLISDLRRALGVTSVVVTHDMRSAFALADRVLMLHRGQVVAEGTPQEMRTSEHPVVKQFISGAPEGPIQVDDVVTVT